MPKATEPKPKPWRGWAVFDVSGKVLPWTISDANSTAWGTIEWMKQQQDRKILKSLGYTVRRVVVTPEGASARRDPATRELADIEKRMVKLESAARSALSHIAELRDAWVLGAISESDGKGGTRSNRNVDVEVELRAALAGAVWNDEPATTH